MSQRCLLVQLPVIRVFPITGIGICDTGIRGGGPDVLTIVSDTADFVYVSIFNSANGIPVPQTTHQHGPIVMDTVDYNITIPVNHPSSLFWFHPHVHGLALNRPVSGLSGLITIGKVGDNVRGDAANTAWPNTNVRHLMLKEIQVLAVGTIGFDSGPQPVANGEVLNQEDPGFCAQFPDPGEVRHGSCPGADNTAGGGNNYTGGKWYMTVNGQQFPTIPVTEPDGEIWRVGTGAGSLSWDLQLVNDATQTPMTVQLIAIDGVAVHLPQDTTTGSAMRGRVGRCPRARADAGALRAFPHVQCRNSRSAPATSSANSS
jgi:hypothetical protein